VFNCEALALNNHTTTAKILLLKNGAVLLLDEFDGGHFMVFLMAAIYAATKAYVRSLGLKHWHLRLKTIFNVDVLAGKLSGPLYLKRF
jgi:hypothetical protein